MIDAILAFFSGLPRELYVFVISILPLIELRGAVPVGVAVGLPFFLNFPISVLGNMLPIPFILLFIPKILDFLARFRLFRPIVAWLRKKANKHSGRIMKNADSEEKEKDLNVNCDMLADKESFDKQGENDESRGSASKKASRRMSVGLFVGLMLFVALPIPGTGAWSGALVASLFDLPKKQSFLAILCGVLICGVIMCLASYGVLGFLSFLL